MICQVTFDPNNMRKAIYSFENIRGRYWLQDFISVHFSGLFEVNWYVTVLTCESFYFSPLKYSMHKLPFSL